MSIPIQIKWFKTLAKLAKQARKDQEKWFEGEKDLFPMSISRLIGFASSAEIFISLNKKTNGKKDSKK